MPKLKDGHVGRYVVLPKPLDEWLEQKAKQRGLNSPQKYAVMLLSDAHRADTEQSGLPAREAEQAAAQVPFPPQARH